MPGPANSLNITETGFQSFDGVSVFKGRSLTAGTGITISNGDGVSGNPTISTSGTLTSVTTSNATPQFALTGSVENIDFRLTNLILGSSGASISSATGNVGLGSFTLNGVSTGTSNTAIGFQSAPLLSSGVYNTFVGSSAGNLCSTSIQNTGIGGYTLGLFTTGAANAGSNTAIGYFALHYLTTGISNTCLGSNSGTNYTSSESSNIAIGNIGTVSESNVIRIGTQGSGTGQQNTCYIAGIAGVTNSNNTLVTQNSATGQLGATTSTYPNTAGTSGNILTSDGTNWTSASLSATNIGMVKLNTQTPSSAASISFSSTYITSTYQTYVIVVDNLTSSGSTLNLTVSADNGSTYQSTNYTCGYEFLGYNSTVLQNQNSGSAYQLFTGISATLPTTGTFYLTGAGKANATTCYGQGSVAGAAYFSWVTGTQTTTTINNIKLAMASGTMTGTITLYGLVQ